jgi:anti-sigma B factor antagonist
MMADADTLVELTVAGPRLDAAAAPSFKLAATAVLGERPARLLLDLSAVEFVDSTGLGAIVGLLKQMATGARIGLVGINPAVNRLLTITRLDSLFLICGSLAEGRNAFAE